VPVLSTQPVDGVLEYAEGIHVGYRAWLRAGREPAYPFGHGLGYTDWEYESLRVAGGGEARVRIRNTGARPGREVVQAYLARPDSAVERPVRWLAGFAVVEAGPGEAVEAAVHLEPRAFEHWDGGWQREPGEFELHVGRSVADLRLHGQVWGSDPASKV
jgi:beta-glucosidase